MVGVAGISGRLCLDLLAMSAFDSMAAVRLARRASQYQSVLSNIAVQDCAGEGLDMALFPKASGAEVNVWLADEGDAVYAAQFEVARRITENLPSLKEKAANYLDLFVDRAHACGSKDEDWWLDEIDLREGGLDGTLTYAMHFALSGDDGGLWTVYVRTHDDEDRPFRFERRQG